MPNRMVCRLQTLCALVAGLCSVCSLLCNGSTMTAVKSSQNLEQTLQAMLSVLMSCKLDLHAYISAAPQLLRHKGLTNQRGARFPLPLSATSLNVLAMRLHSLCCNIGYADSLHSLSPLVCLPTSLCALRACFWSGIPPSASLQQLA